MAEDEAAEADGNEANGSSSGSSGVWGCIVLPIVLVGAFIYGFFISGDETNDDAKPLTEPQVGALERGQTRSSVERELGVPSSVDEDVKGDLDCIYYFRTGSDNDQSWELCFRGSGPNARLTRRALLNNE